MRPHQFKKGDVIYSKGDEGDQMFVIMQGSVQTDEKLGVTFVFGEKCL